MGWYGGTGARLVLEFHGFPGGQRPIPKPRAQDGLVECDWPVSCRVPVGPDWVSGVYLARLTAREMENNPSFRSSCGSRIIHEARRNAPRS